LWTGPISEETMPAERLLTVREVCALVNLRPWAVYGLIERGEIPSIRVGRSVRVSPAALRRKYGDDVLPQREAAGAACP
jgi:excisionase family DNA binding protein